MNINIARLERYLPDGVVITAHWTADKQNGDYTASSYGSINLPAKDPSDPTFVAYEDITEAQAVEWVKKAMGEEQLEELEANLDGQIEAQKHPTQASGVPWQAEEIEELTPPADPINVNTATKTKLRTLNGVDAVRAQAIIDGRPWSSTTDLATIQGISSDMIAGWDITV